MAHYPPVGFHFRVAFKELAAADVDLRFTEVGGLATELATEEVPEGGENRFIQKYPVRSKYPELVLKRGLAIGQIVQSPPPVPVGRGPVPPPSPPVLVRSSPLLDWVRQSLEDLVIVPKDVDVQLLNDEHKPLLTWHVFKAYPTKWAVSDLNASANAVAIESMQLFYQYFTLDAK